MNSGPTASIPRGLVSLPTFPPQNLGDTLTLDANVGSTMKRHLVWFESLDGAGASEAEPWEARGGEQRYASVEKLRGEDLSRLQRAVISNPVARVTPPARRTRGRRTTTTK
jgi:hypothetical protein